MILNLSEYKQAIFSRRYFDIHPQAAIAYNSQHGRPDA